MKKRRLLLSCSVAALLLVASLALFRSCSHGDGEGVADPCPSVYYWRTQLALSPTERAFLARRHVGKVYLHLFDVVRKADGSLVPDGTLLVEDTLPSAVRVIPVVYMTPDIMADTAGLDALPQLIVNRVAQMLEQNHLGPLGELQLDFDWTATNQALYFQLLERTRALLKQRQARLSATVRLHQLRMTPPPVDYGALMVYNVGQLTNPDEPNSILSTSAVSPYLAALDSYNLPLSVALPLYSWDLLFRGGKFCMIVNGLQLSDAQQWRKVDSTHYEARCYMPVPDGAVTDRAGRRILPGDEVRHESVSAPLLLETFHALKEHNPKACRQVILYHLDEGCLKTLTDAEYEEIFAGH